MNGTSFQSDIKYWLKQGNAVNHLLFWNILVFVVVGLVNVLAFFSGSFGMVSVFLSDKLALHSFYPTLLRQPWGVFTYMFTHEGLFHLFFNMLNLYWFGNLFRSFLGNQRVLPVYILGSLAGALAFVLAFNYLPTLQPFVAHATLIGASASVMCLLVSCATLTPNYEIGLLFIGSIRLKWLALAIVVLDLITIPYANPGGMFAHLGGALLGFSYIKLLQGGRDMAAPLVYLFDKLGNRPRITLKPKVQQHRKAGNFKPKKSPLRVIKKEENPQRHLDELLDKINERGYHSLSSDEKAFLEKFSKEN
ncbi:Membrane associated serine protease, rhomboid family [Chitinophaga costaii]|uniref:Membrane associated serine protease, rhomboid family n=1 Tax=Chitinophaga costaii TaxID=1335309 RepID=A0A1C4DD45_9BACT|nr:rhomboid family intramembrane serine protease [Chitinophaga costaii]PUZ24569.1 rhomboid family intramembrane serine protease [Chitinophaga costaii]SCC29203.1 Membrane associated serine protease, rhomboid family [Chitinophaga costaii]